MPHVLLAMGCWMGDDNSACTMTDASIARPCRTNPLNLLETTPDARHGTAEIRGNALTRADAMYSMCPHPPRRCSFFKSNRNNHGALASLVKSMLQVMH